MMIPESYGAVSFPTTSNLRRRRPHQPDNQDVKESRYAANGVFLKSQNKNSRSREEESRPVVYKYNSTIAKLLITSLSVTYLCHHSPIPFIVTLYAVLFLYGVDLSGSKEGVTVGIWIACGTIFISVVIEYYSTGQEHAWGFLGLIADGLNLFCLVRLLVNAIITLHLKESVSHILNVQGCWGTLQMEWIYRDALSYAKLIEAKLHSILPLAAAATVSCRCLDLESDASYRSCSPFLFAVILSYGIFLLADVPSSFVVLKKPNYKSRLSSGNLFQGKVNNDMTDTNSETNKYSISETSGYVLSYSLLVIPTMFSILPRQIAGAVDKNMIINLTLVQSSSYILHSILRSKKALWWCHSCTYLTVKNRKVSKLAIAIISALLSFQYMYLHPTTRYPHILPSWLIYACFNFGFAGVACTVWISKRRNERGEQLYGNKYGGWLLIVSLLCIGMSFPVPEDFILPTAGSILCIVTIVVTNMYQFLELSISSNILWLSIVLHRHSMLFGSENGFKKICVISVFITTFIFSAHNLALDGTAIMSIDGSKFKFVGPLFFLYICIITIIEWMLNVESVGDEFHLPSNATMFPQLWTYFTSIILVVLSLHLFSLKIVASISMHCILSITLGKAFATAIVYERHWNVYGNQISFVYYCLACSITTWIFLVPYFGANLVMGTHPSTLSQCHMPFAKTTRIYLGLMLPTAIISSVYLMISTVFSHFIHHSIQLKWSTTFHYLFGYSCVLWGATILCIRKHLFPDDGFQSWRKPAVCTLVFGAIELALYPASSFLLKIGITSDPYESISSVVQYNKHQAWEGRWGLIFMCIALFSYYLGPLRPKVDTTSKGGKLRCVAFSLFFGCGLNYFIIKQFGHHLSPVRWALEMIPTSTVAFTLTFSTVMMLNSSAKTIAISAKVLENRMISSFGFVLFIFISKFAIFGLSPRPVSESVDCTEMLVLCCFSILVSSLLKLKKFRDFDTHDLNNWCAIISWVTSTICVYGCFGIASINVNSRFTCIFGFQVSVVLTFLASLVLMDINMFQKRKAPSIRRGARTAFRNFHSVTITDRLLFCAFGSLTVYIIVAFYSIMLRGMCGNVPTSYADFINSMSHSKDEEIDPILNLAAQYIPHKGIAARASKLAASGFWTSRKRLVPLKHLIGLIIGPIYTWKKTYVSLSISHQGQGHSIDRSTVFFNALVLLTCHGIPSQSAASCICILIVLYQSYSERNRRWKSKMII